MILYYSADLFRQSFADFLNDIRVSNRSIKINKPLQSVKKSKGASMYITVLVEQARKRFSLRLKNVDNDKRIKCAF